MVYTRLRPMQTSLVPTHRVSLLLGREGPVVLDWSVLAATIRGGDEHLSHHAQRSMLELVQGQGLPLVESALP